MAEACKADWGQNATRKQADFTLVGSFQAGGNNKIGVVEMAWLEPAIYIAYDGFKGVRAFSDQAPYQELDPILIEDFQEPDSLTSSAQNQTIYVSDVIAELIWKIQLPDKTLTKLTYLTGSVPGRLSVTPKNELLVVFGRLHYCSREDGPTVVDPELLGTGGDSSPGDQRAFYTIELFQQDTDRRKAFIPLPVYVEAVGCAVQLHDENFVVSHSNDLSSDEFFVSLVSYNDGKILRTLDSRFFSLTCRVELYPHHIAINDEGFIILADSELSKITIFNPEATEFSTIANKEFEPYHPMRIVYNNGRLLVQNAKPFDEDAPVYHYIPVFSIVRLN